MTRPDLRWLAVSAVAALVAFCTVGPRPPPPAPAAPVPAGPTRQVPVLRAPDPPPERVDRSLTVWLPADPADILSADCFADHSPVWRYPYPSANLAGAFELAEDRYFGAHDLPGWARAALDGARLSPRDLGWLGQVDPWVDLALLGAEVGWSWGTGRDVRAQARHEGVTGARLDERMRRADASAQEAIYDHAVRLSASDVPEIREAALHVWATYAGPGDPMVPLELLVDPSLSDNTRTTLLKGHCQEVVDLDAAGRNALAELIRSTDNGPLAVDATLLALRAAWTNGEDLTPWLRMLDEAEETCLRWGADASNARDPTLQSFEGLPEVARPEGFPAAVARFAARAELTVDDVDCSTPPCTAWLTDPQAPRWLGAAAADVWGLGVGLYADQRDPERVTVVAVDDALPEGQRTSLAIGRADREVHRRWCPDPGAISAARIEYGGAPRTWEEALQAALFACHRSGTPLTEPWSGLARWDGAWTFDPPLPLLDCVAAGELPLAPTGSLTVGLALGLR
ncbi:MAG: hypothetical protein R3F59_10900 [Myxococcota bacterium]